MTKDSYIKLHNVYVRGIDTHSRANGFRQWFLLQKSLKPKYIPILENVSLEIKKGDKVGLIGLNGSGKSSILKVISGNYPPHSGTIKVVGSVLPLIEMGAGFDPELSARDNIKLSFAFRGKLHLYTKELEEEIIDFAELRDKIELPFKNYSSGMQARLGFASAIFQTPDILLLDEIFAAGDAGFVAKSEKAIKNMLEKSAIAVIVAHDMSILKHLCNRFILIHQGAMVAEDNYKSINELYNNILNKKNV